MVSSIIGVRVYEEPSTPPGSCAFDSLAGGRGLQPGEVRVNIQVGTDDLASLYGFYEQQATAGFPSCAPFRLTRRADLGPGGFETLCGASATAGPSSADDYLPTPGNGDLTVTVNRGLAVPDHSLATCQAQTEAIVRRIRTAS